jgi:hypothetical protein
MGGKDNDIIRIENKSSISSNDINNSPPTRSSFRERDNINSWSPTQTPFGSILASHKTVFTPTPR